MNHLLDSFKDKGEKYLDIIYRKKAVLTQYAMIYCCKDHDKQSFHYLLSELKSIDRKYLSDLGHSYWGFSRLKENYYALSFMILLKNRYI